jgi:hypothetical protein
VSPQHIEEVITGELATPIGVRAGIRRASSNASTQKLELSMFKSRQASTHTRRPGSCG